MGTRGSFGVHVDGKSKLMYKHHDSYPSGLGLEMLKDLRTLLKDKGVDWIKEKAIALQQVDDEVEPTEAQIELLKPYTDLEVSTQSVQDWYCLLRNIQGDLPGILEVGLMLNSNNFIADSLFCEWAYVVNLDENLFEVYKGFQSKPHSLGRYANLPVSKNNYCTYYACALVAEFPFDNLPTEEDFLKKFVPPVEEG